MRVLLCATAALLCGLVAAQPRTGLRGRQYRYCPCSPTARGYRAEAYSELLAGIEKLHDLFAELNADPALPQSAKVAALDAESQDLWAACRASYNVEECVNADAALRVQAACKAGGACASFCKYDRGSWRNEAGGLFTASCNALPQYRSTYPPIVQGNFPPEIRPSASNPNPGPEGRPKSTISEKPPTDATDAKLPAPAPPSAAGQQNGTTSGAPADNANGTSSLSPDDADLFHPHPPPTRGDPNVNEGCVAIEHLLGYRMSHREHYVRPVLCHEGFCATPNHAIIVGGVWTSMKRLCTSLWSCVRTVKEVNNLDVFRNRRAQVGDITITPYDLRFPRAGVFFVQAAEKLLYVAVDCVDAIAALALTLAAISLQRRYAGLSTPR